MAMKLTAESFQAILKQSGLIDADQLEKVFQEIDPDKIDLEDPCAVAQELVERGLLTLWQADKLLKGKHKGFVLGKYRLLSLLGKGGMSSVYLAEHLVMRRRVAIKVLPAKRVHDTSYLARFHREAQAVAALDHPNIVRAYDVDQEVDGGTEIHFIVMEYVDGQSLHDLVVTRGAMGYAEAAEVIRQSSNGLQHAHDAGMVHRDIKPGNLLIDSAGTVKILDLGLARFFEDQESESLTIAHEEKVLGTADYIAPEQALDSHKVDLRADIYSLGCTIYFLLTGHPPFTEGTLTQRLMCHQTKEPPPIENDRPDAPQSLMAMIRKMMAKNPDERYQTAAEVAEAFAQWLQQNGGAGEAPHLAVGAGEVGSSIIAAGSSVHGTVDNVPPPASETKEPSSIVPLAADSDIQKSSPAKKPPRRQAAETNADMAASDTLKQPSSKSVPLSDDIDSAGLKPDSSTKLPSASPKKHTAAQQPPSSKKAAPTTAKKPPASEKPASEKKPSSTAKQPPSMKKNSPASAIRPAKRAGNKSGPGRKASSASTTAGSSPKLSLDEAEPAEAILEPIKFEPVRQPASSPGLSGIGNSFSSEVGEDRSLIVTSVVLLSVLAFAVIAYFVLSSIGGSQGGAVVEVDGARPVGARNSTPAAAQAEFSVGPNGDFLTIAKGLEALRKTVGTLDPDAPRTLRVMGGAIYDERLEIDNSEPVYPRVVRILSVGEEPAVLAPLQGDGPVVMLTGVEQLTLEGFTIDAKAKAVAVELRGPLPGTRLDNLEIINFTSTGILGDATSGSSRVGPIRIEGCILRSDSAGAEGLLFVGKEVTPLNHLELTGLRVVGPMKAGVVFAVNAVEVKIQTSSFAQVDGGIVFEGDALRLRDVLVQNNEILHAKRGIVFEHMPRYNSEGLSLLGNRFFDIPEQEAVVENGFSTDDWNKLMATKGSRIAANKSNRPAGPPPEGQADLFSTGIKRGVKNLEPRFELILDASDLETAP